MSAWLSNACPMMCCMALGCFQGRGLLYTCIDVSDKVILKDCHAVIHISTRLSIGEPAWKGITIAMRLMKIYELASCNQLESFPSFAACDTASRR